MSIAIIFLIISCSVRDPYSEVTLRNIQKNNSTNNRAEIDRRVKAAIPLLEDRDFTDAEDVLLPGGERTEPEIYFDPIVFNLYHYASFSNFLWYVDFMAPFEDPNTDPEVRDIMETMNAMILADHLIRMNPSYDGPLKVEMTEEVLKVMKNVSDWQKAYDLEANRQDRLDEMIEAYYPEPRIGMTVKEAKAISWGAPDAIEDTPSGNDKIEIWIYSDGDSTKKIMFTDDVISKIIE